MVGDGGSSGSGCAPFYDTWFTYSYSVFAVLTKLTRVDTLLIGSLQSWGVIMVIIVLNIMPTDDNADNCCFYRVYWLQCPALLIVMFW